MPPAKPFILYGAPVSLYTGKARSYMRKQRGLEWIERLPSHERYRNVILPSIQRNVIPVIEAPDGTIVQDTVDIIDYFEGSGIVSFSAYPETPRQMAFAYVMEAFADESLLRQAMHYRWSFIETNTEFISDQFAAIYGLSDEQARARGQSEMRDGMTRMARTLAPLGITNSTIPELERVLITLLDALQEHFLRWPYLLGWRPTIADYGLMGPLFAHLCRDPHSSVLVKTRAPQVVRWVERMNAHDLDIPEFEVEHAGQLLPGDEIPETLAPLLGLMAKYYLPEISAVAQATNAWIAENDPPAGSPVHPKPHIRALGEIEFRYGDCDMHCAMRPFMVYKHQRLTDFCDDLDSTSLDTVSAFLTDHGLEGLLTLELQCRVERRGNLEVWSPKDPATAQSVRRIGSI